MNDVEKLQMLIDEANYIVFFGGAGVSTDSGIKDFRGKNGIYTTSQDVSPEYLLSHECLKEEPKVFFEYYKNNMNFLNVKPNITHKYLTKLEECGKLKAIITQNIDGLHQKADAKNVLEIHGTINKCYCQECKKDYPKEYIFNSKGIPTCICGGIIRPDVVLYGEALNDSFNKAIEYIMKADLLIVAGTSLTVQPACSLINYFHGKNLVLINETKTPYDYSANIVINKPLKDIFSKLK